MIHRRGILVAAMLVFTVIAALVLHRSRDVEKLRLMENHTSFTEARFPKNLRPSTANTLPELPPPTELPNPPGSPSNAGWADARLAELEKLAWYDDVGSLKKILAELRSPLPEIRHAALAATRAFGSRDAVPYLEQIAIGTSDPEEHKALTEAISYLNLPTFLESAPAE